MDETRQAVRATRRYIVEFLAAMGAYVITLLAVLPFVSSGSDSPWRIVAALLPLVPIGLMVWVAVRHYGRVDEMGRRAMVESLAFGFILSAPVVITLGFLESAGIGISIWWAWVAMGASWFAGAMLVQLRYR